MVFNDSTSRRRFLSCTRSGLEVAVGALAVARGKAATNNRQRLPREVWVAGISQVGLTAQNSNEMCHQMIRRMEEVVPLQPDIICLPEVSPFAGLPKGARPPLQECAEERTGPVLDLFAGFAREHRCYVVCSTYSKEGRHCYIAAVLFDREGRYVGEYRKTHPTDEEMALGVTPGPLHQGVFQTDFGTVGIQICYDVNWYEPWGRLSQLGAEIVFWPSAFAGGKMLNSLAWMNKYYIVSGIQFEHPTKIVDPLGEDVAVTGRAGNWVCAPINLESAIVQSVEHIRKFPAIQKKYGRKFRLRVLHVEALAMIEGFSSDISVSQVLKEFDIPTSREMLATSARLQDAKRPPEGLPSSVR